MTENRSENDPADTIDSNRVRDVLRFVPGARVTALLKRLNLLLFCAACMAPAAVHAADAVTDAIQASYPAYRTALFRTNSKSQAPSELAIAQARQDWRSLIDRFADKPPPPYDRDPEFASTLAKVATVYAKAENEIRETKLGQAHETLEAARDLMAEMRRRNGVITYSDHMNAYHAEMEHLIGDASKQLLMPNGFMLIMARVGALEYLAQRLRSEAPKPVLADPEFVAASQAVEGSLAAVRAALLNQDQTATLKAIGQLKAPYGRLFLRFG